MANTAPPSTIYAGDSSTWTATLASYPATDYRARCVWKLSGAEPVGIDGTASGDDHVFTLPPELSGAMIPGGWTWAYRVTKLVGSVSAIADTGTTCVSPDPASETDEQSHAEKCLELVKAALEDRLVDVQESFSVLGQDISKVSAIDLIAMKNHYQAQVNHERRKENMRRGGARGRTGVAGRILFGQS